MLWAMRLLSAINPWLVVGVLVALAASFGAVFFYGVSVGSTAAELACEKRVAKIMDEIDAQNKRIEAENDRWQKLIDEVTQHYNERVAEEEKQNVELEKQVADFESKLQDVPDCRITRGDLDSVRGKQ